MPASAWTEQGTKKNLLYVNSLERERGNLGSSFLNYKRELGPYTEDQMEVSQQELGPTGPLTYLSEGKFIYLPVSGKRCRMVDPYIEEKIQDLNIDLANVCITPRPSTIPWEKLPHW